MADSTTLTVRLKSEVKDRLALLSASTSRSSSFLAAEAIASYVDRELQIVAGIERGLADIRAGNLVPHDAAMDELDSAIEDAVKGEA